MKKKHQRLIDNASPEKEALAASKLRYRRLFESAQNGVLILDAETGIVVDANPFLLELLDSPVEEVVGKAIWELGFFKDIVANRNSFAELQRKKHIRYEDKPLEDSHGRRHEVGFVCNVCLDPVNHKKVLQCNIRDNTEHKRAEDQIEKLARFPFENPNPVLRISTQGIVEYANEAAEVLLPALGAAKTGEPVNAEWRAHIDKAIANALPINIELQAKGLTFDATLAPVADHGYVNLYACDITVRKQTQAALAKSEEQYRMLFESSRDAIMTLAPPDWRFTTANPATLEMFAAATEAEFTEAALWKLSPERQPDGQLSAEAAAKMIGIAMRDGSHFFLWRHRRLDGEEFPATVLLSRTQTGEKVFLQATVRDISERKQAEDALRESLQLTERIINAIPVRVFWKDENLVYLGCNAAFARDAGFSDPQEIIGKDDLQMVWTDQAERYRADDREVIESGLPKLLIEEPQTTPEGKTLTLLTSKIPLRNADGEIIGLLGTYMDVTEQRQMESQFRQMQKMESVGRLAGGVAHDFNNMLQVILGYTEMALGKVDPSNPLFASLQEIKKAASRSGDLTRQLLAFAREQTIAPVILDLNDEISKMLSMLHRLLREEVTLIWQPGPDLHSVKLDPSQIDQILVNLCVNAQDSISGNGKIIIETANAKLDETYCTTHAEAVPGDYVILKISDTGCGMNRQTLAKLFEPFFTTKEVGNGNGTGLGLATVYGIVKQNGGFITVYSEPEQGATFKIHLPQTTDLPLESDGAAAIRLPDVHGETILLVEDEASLRTVYNLFLDELGYTILTAENPAEALTLAEQHSDDIQLLLTDVVMPGMNGKELAEAVRAVNPSIKVLFMSGYTADIIADRGVLEQDAAFIAKPFSRDELARKVRDILKARKS